jgi:peptidoglycan/LPS O-acetylase OafA/YrhL
VSSGRALAGLLTIAVVLIAAHHSAQPQIFAGDLGVVIFLMASGYVLSVSLVGRRNWDGAALRLFWRTHLASLYPMLVLLVIGFAFAEERLATSPGRYLLQVVATLTFTVNIFASAKQNMGSFLHLWPFAMEEQWFLLVTLAALWLRRHPRSDRGVIDALLAVAVLSSLDEILTYNHSNLFHPDSQVAPLALATALAVARTGSTRGWRALTPSWEWAALAVLVVALTIVWGTVETGHAASLRVPVVTWSTLVLVAHVTGAGRESPVVRLLGAPIFLLPSTFATAFYLSHYPMLHTFGHHPSRAAGTTLALIASAAVSIAVTYGLAGVARRQASFRNADPAPAQSD